ncbi:MAG TPA: hypothetical protein VFC47_08495, partial [Caulobacteraceae bacterium]|nr:hypothetical protein [Caulobacteraceae bacterium]
GVTDGHGQVTFEKLEAGGYTVEMWDMCTTRRTLDGQILSGAQSELQVFSGGQASVNLVSAPIRCGKPGAPAFARDGAGRKLIAVIAPPGGRITVSIFDRWGNDRTAGPGAGSPGISDWARAGGKTSGVVARGVTDGHGQVTFENLKAGRYAGEIMWDMCTTRRATIDIQSFQAGQSGSVDVVSAPIQCGAPGAPAFALDAAGRKLAAVIAKPGGRITLTLSGISPAGPGEPGTHVVQVMHWYYGTPIATADGGASMQGGGRHTPGKYSAATVRGLQYPQAISPAESGEGDFHVPGAKHSQLELAAGSQGATGQPAPPDGCPDDTP